MQGVRCEDTVERCDSVAKNLCHTLISHQHHFVGVCVSSVWVSLSLVFLCNTTALIIIIIIICLCLGHSSHSRRCHPSHCVNQHTHESSSPAAAPLAHLCVLVINSSGAREQQRQQQPGLCALACGSAREGVTPVASCATVPNHLAHSPGSTQQQHPPTWTPRRKTWSCCLATRPPTC